MFFRDQEIIRAGHHASCITEGYGPEAPGDSSFATVMTAKFMNKTHLPVLAFLSTSLLLFFAYTGTERPHDSRFRYPDIPPPGASDNDRLHYSECASTPTPLLSPRTPHSRELMKFRLQHTKSSTQRNITFRHGSQNPSRSHTCRWKTPSTTTWERTLESPSGITGHSPARTTTGPSGSRWKAERGSHSLSRCSTN